MQPNADPAAPRRPTRWWLLAIVAVVLLAPAVTTAWLVNRDPSDAAQPCFPFAQRADGTTIELGSLGGPGRTFGFATDVNARGEVVGASSAGEGSQHAFLSRDGVMTDLGALDGTTTSWAAAVNDNGQVVGYSEGPGPYSRAFLWTDGRMTDLGDLGGSPPLHAKTARANDINAHGQVVGNSAGAPQVFRGTLSPGLGSFMGFLWVDGAMTRLETPEALFSDAVAINDQGQILGTGLIVGSDQTHVLLWHDGVVTDLGPGRAVALNNRGVALISRPRFNDGSPGCELWEDGQLTPLTTTDGTDFEPWPERALNDSGVVLGQVPDGQDARPATWHDGTVTLLPVEGSVSQARAIGPTGIVVGVRGL